MCKRLIYAVLLMMAFLPASLVFAQDEEEEASDDGNKPTRAHFESAWLIDDQTVVVPTKKTMEFMIQHRFGVVSNGPSDLWGLYAPSNIRLGISYTISDNIGIGGLKGPLNIGIGTTKNNSIQDLNWKYGILEQTRNGKIPVSITYFGNVAMEAIKKKEDLPNGNSSDRYSFFHQLIISRRFSPKISIQLAPSISHYNVVEPLMKNDHIAIGAGGRFKFSPQSALLVNVVQPITKHDFYNPYPNISFGLEVGTSAHTFQIFLTNFNAIIQQRNNVFNQNDPYGDGFLIGFNINRLWGF